MNNTQAVLAILVMAGVTAATRFLPFIIFSGDRPTPKIITYLGKVLPFAIMGMLLVYCLRDITFTEITGFLPRIIAGAVTALLHIWKRSTIISIAGGTVLYMILVQLVFA